MKFSLPNRRLIYIAGGAVLVMAAVSFIMIGGGGDSADNQQVASHVKGKPSGKATGNKAPADARPQDTAPGVPEEASQDDVLKRAKYTYRSLGRVDPFRRLVDGPMNSSRYFGDQLDPEVIRLVGILEEKEGGRRALVEDARGFGYVLRKGDRVLRGKVVRVEADFVTIRHSLYGVTETLTLTLDRKGQGGFVDGRIR
jgi:hypothetical protein